MTNMILEFCNKFVVEIMYQFWCRKLCDNFQRNLLEYYNAIDTEKMMMVFAR